MAICSVKRTKSFLVGAVVVTSLHVGEPVAHGSDMTEQGLSYTIDGTDRQIIIVGNDKKIVYSASGSAISKVDKFDCGPLGSGLMFLDLSGVSVGGAVRLFCSSTVPSLIGGEFFAARLGVLEWQGHYYIELLQHDTENNFFVSNILTIHSMKLVSVTNTKAWEPVIRRYRDWRARLHNPSEKARIACYLALAEHMSGQDIAARKEIVDTLGTSSANPLCETIARRLGIKQ
jgi:hypothetical protein